MIMFLYLDFEQLSLITLISDARTARALLYKKITCVLNCFIISVAKMEFINSTCLYFV